MKSLQMHKAVFDHLQPSSSWLSFLQPKLCGQIDEYQTEMDVIWEGRHKALVYRVQLKNPVSVPWFFWDSLFLSEGEFEWENVYKNLPIDLEFGPLEIDKGEWLTQYAYYGKSMPQVSKHLKKMRTEAIKDTFRCLVALARKIDSGEILIDSKIEKQKNIFYKNCLIVIALIIIIAPLVYWWLYHS